MVLKLARLATAHSNSHGAELVVRVLERQRASEYRIAHTESEFFYRRHLDCFDRQAVLFVDVGSSPWSVMLSNTAFSQVPTLIPPSCLCPRQLIVVPKGPGHLVDHAHT